MPHKNPFSPSQRSLGEWARPRPRSSVRRRNVATFIKAQLDSYKLLRKNGASASVLRDKASNILHTWQILENV